MVNMAEDATPFESERPVIYALEEIEDATNNFDETRKIGVGGYGSVYFGMLEEKVWKPKTLKHIFICWLRIGEW